VLVAYIGSGCGP